MRNNYRQWRVWLRVVSLSFVICHLSFSRVAAQPFTATVVDGVDGHPLSFASIYAGPGVSTITNAEGQFSIACDSASVLRISYVGYQSKSIRAAHLSGRVGLLPMEQQLQEVTVLPIAPLIRKVTKETLRQLQKFKKQTTHFFYRQTASSDSLCYEFAEAYIKGRPAAWLRDLQLLTGRYAAIRPDSLHYYSFYSNFYTFSQIELAAKPKEFRRLSAIPPLMPEYRDYYDVDYEIISSPDTTAVADGSPADGRLIVLHFTPKPHIRQAIIEAKLYVDEATLHLRKVVGIGRNIVVMHVDKEKHQGRLYDRNKYIPTEYAFIVNMTEEHGFAEVQSVFTLERHELRGKHIETRSLLYNVGQEAGAAGHAAGKKRHERPSDMVFYGNLHGTIEQQGYDAQFWRNNPVVQRTPVEEQVMLLFERKNLFGVFK